MTPAALYDAMARGHDRFAHKKSGRVYLLDPAQRAVLKPFEDRAMVVGFPEEPHPRQRGRRWQWLNPEALTLAP